MGGREGPGEERRFQTVLDKGLTYECWKVAQKQDESVSENLECGVEQSCPHRPPDLCDEDQGAQAACLAVTPSNWTKGLSTPRRLSCLGAAGPSPSCPALMTGAGGGERLLKDGQGEASSVAWRRVGRFSRVRVGSAAARH